MEPDMTLPTLPLGAIAQTLPAIGLGCMGMSEFYGETDDEQSFAVLERAVELGVRMFDTAYMYGAGHNEKLLGRLIASTRQKLFIATKFGIRKLPGQYARTIDNSPAYMRGACEASLKRLGVEHIDLYYVHRIDVAQPIEKTMGALVELIDADKIGAIGLSEVSAETLRRAHAVYPIAAVQMEYSLTTRDAEAEILPLCRDLGIAFVAYSPLGRGLLSGAIDTTALAPDDFRRLSPRFTAAALDTNLKLLAPLRTIAQDRGVLPAQIALAWVLAKGVFAIPGTKRLHYLESNVMAANIGLSDREIATLDAAFEPGVFVGDRYPEAGQVGLNA
jgi:aryl-alcohol dehydrogenase-like predicted oxidoreductase